MPDCCDRIERTFDIKAADKDIRDYLRDGPDPTTQLLIDHLGEAVAGLTLLDIGGGIGAIDLELLARGLGAAMDVDISAAYIAVARRQATARGFGDRTQYRQGDFVTIADDIEPADLVALDRVICCYPNLETLADRAAQRTRVRLGVVHPRDRWWLRTGAAVMNAVGRPFGWLPFFVHRTARLEEILRSAGLEREWSDTRGIWRIAVYRRVAPITA